MNSLYILIPLALVFTTIAVYLFFWSVDSKQYDDLDSAAHSILFDDDDNFDREKNSCDNNSNETNSSDNNGSNHEHPKKIKPGVSQADASQAGEL